MSGAWSKIRGDPAAPGFAWVFPREAAAARPLPQSGRHRFDTPMRRRADGSYEAIDWDTTGDLLTAT